MITFTQEVDNMKHVWACKFNGKPLAEHSDEEIELLEPRNEYEEHVLFWACREPDTRALYRKEQQ